MAGKCLALSRRSILLLKKEKIYLFRQYDMAPTATGTEACPTIIPVGRASLPGSYRQYDMAPTATGTEACPTIIPVGRASLPGSFTVGFCAGQPGDPPLRFGEQLGNLPGRRTGVRSPTLTLPVNGEGEEVRMLKLKR